MSRQKGISSKWLVDGNTWMPSRVMCELEGTGTPSEVIDALEDYYRNESIVSGIEDDIYVLRQGLHAARKALEQGDIGAMLMHILFIKDTAALIALSENEKDLAGYAKKKINRAEKVIKKNVSLGGATAAGYKSKSAADEKHAEIISRWTAVQFVPDKDTEKCEAIARAVGGISGNGVRKLLNRKGIRPVKKRRPRA